MILLIITVYLIKILILNMIMISATLETKRSFTEAMNNILDLVGAKDMH